MIKNLVKFNESFKNKKDRKIKLKLILREISL